MRWEKEKNENKKQPNSICESTNTSAHFTLLKD